ncbi:MAG: imidazolonepropionase [Elusimicrobiales bacterium]
MEKPLLIANIGQLLTFAGPDAPRAGAAMSDTGLVRGAGVIISAGKTVFAGAMKEAARHPLARRARVLDAQGRVALPGFCDSHTHPVFAAPRLADFRLRLKGAGYAEIKAAGGGIASSAAAVRKASLRELAEMTAARFDRFLSCGTTSLEAKSGYGLSLDAEIKSLLAIRRAAELSPVDVAPTLLAAHSVPPEFSGADKYCDYIIREILPAAARRKLAVFCDIFCEKGFFSPAQTLRLMRAARALGLAPKVHAEQLGRYGGARAAARCGAISADHLDYCGAGEIAALKKAGVMAVLLPASNHFLGMGKYPPARDMIARGLPVALATDFNPGTSPCWNMQFAVSLACLKMKLSPEEALCAATVNGAWAMGLGGRAGVIAAGRQADIALFDAKDYREIAYYFGGSLCHSVIKKGRIICIIKPL